MVQGRGKTQIQTTGQTEDNPAHNRIYEAVGNLWRNNDSAAPHRDFLQQHELLDDEFERKNMSNERQTAIVNVINNVVEYPENNFASNNKTENDSASALLIPEHEINNQDSSSLPLPTKVADVTSSETDQFSYEDGDKGAGRCYIKGCPRYGCRFRRLNTHLTSLHGMIVSRYSSKYKVMIQDHSLVDNIPSNHSIKNAKNTPINASYGMSIDSAINDAPIHVSSPHVHKPRSRGRPAKKINEKERLEDRSEQKPHFQKLKRPNIEIRGKHYKNVPYTLRGPLKHKRLGRASKYRAQRVRKDRAVTEHCMIPHCKFFQKSYKFLEVHLKLHHKLTRQQYERKYCCTSPMVKNTDEPIITKVSINPEKEGYVNLSNQQCKNKNLTSKSFTILSSEQTHQPAEVYNEASKTPLMPLPTANTQSSAVSDMEKLKLKSDYHLRSTAGKSSESLKRNGQLMDEAAVQCPFASLGCLFKGNPLEISNHLHSTSYIHMSALWDNFIKTRELGSFQKSPTRVTHFWLINNFQHHLHMAKSGDPICLFSEQYTTGKNGYCFYLCVYPNGFLDGLNSHVSIYLHLAAGPCDIALPWPFKQSFTIAVVSHLTSTNKASQHVKYLCKPNPDLSFLDEETFKRPTKHESNQGWGKTKFISHDKILNGHFLKENTLMIAVEIEAFDLADVVKL